MFYLIANWSCEQSADIVVDQTIGKVWIRFFYEVLVLSIDFQYVFNVVSGLVRH